MIVLGLLLMVIAVAAVLVLAFQNRQHIDLHVLGAHFNVAAYWLAVASVVIMAILVLGWSLWRAGAKRAIRQRRERRALTRENRQLTDRNQTSDTDRTTPPSAEG